MSTSHTSYTPLFNPDTDEPLSVLRVESHLELARQALAETAGSNIHDHNGLIRAAVRLDGTLRSLVAALDAERGESA